jgi:hypothetical protein
MNCWLPGKLENRHGKRRLALGSVKLLPYVASTEEQYGTYLRVT